MKGTIFLRPLEFGIEAIGEKWRQGETLKGRLKIKNHGADEVSFSKILIELDSAKFRKIKNKDNDAFTSIEAHCLQESVVLKKDEEREWPFQFSLSEDCPITDKDGSLYLVIKTNEGDIAGSLELVIEPKLAIVNFIEVFENFLRFKVQQTKFSKGMIELKMKPPGSREFGHIDSLVLRIKETKKTMELEYNFTISAFDTSSGTTLAQKKTIKVNKTLIARDYCLSQDVPNPDFMKSSITAVIKESTPKIFT